MNRPGRAAAALAASLVLISARIVSAADWRDAVPEGWLAAAEFESLPVLEERLATLRGPWGGRALPLTGMAPQLFGSPLADRPWGWVAVETDRSKPALVFFVPTDDFDSFCRGIDADRADDLAIGQVLGNEVAAVHRDGWAMLTFIDTAAVLDAPLTPVPPRAIGAELSLSFSPSGITLAAEGAVEQRRKQLAASRGRRRVAKPFRLPKDLAEVIELLTPNAPLFQCLAEAEQPVSFGVSITPTGDLIALAEWDVRIATAERGVANRLSLDQAIAHFDVAGSLPTPLVDLALATVQSTPHSLIEAAEFPQPQWDDFADAAHDLLRNVRSPSVVLADPGPDDPIAANQAIAFDWAGEPEALGDALGLAVLRWNLLVSTAKARSPIRAALEPLNAEPSNAEPVQEPTGWLLSIDILATGGEEPIPEVKQVLEAFYGDPERLRVRISRRQGGGWLASTLPPGTALTAGPSEAVDGELVTGEFDLARWLTWDHRIKTFGLENALGPVPKAPNLPATAAAKLRILGGDRVRLQATLPGATYEAASRLWSAE